MEKVSLEKCRMMDGSRGDDGTNHLNVGQAGATKMKYRESNLLERWDGGSKSMDPAKTQALELSKYSPKLNPLWKSPVQVNRNSCIFFRYFLLNDLTKYSDYYPHTELPSQIRNL